jgi:hypothetical protein
MVVCANCQGVLVPEGSDDPFAPPCGLYFFGTRERIKCFATMIELNTSHPLSGRQGRDMSREKMPNQFLYWEKGSQKQE